METSSKDQEEEREEKEDEEDPQSSEEEGGLSLVAMTTEPGLIDKSTEDAEIQPASKQESSQQQQQPAIGTPHLTPNQVICCALFFFPLKMNLNFEPFFTFQMRCLHKWRPQLLVQSSAKHFTGSCVSAC